MTAVFKMRPLIGRSPRRAARSGLDEYVQMRDVSARQGRPPAYCTRCRSPGPRVAGPVPGAPGQVQCSCPLRPRLFAGAYRPPEWARVNGPDLQDCHLRDRDRHDDGGAQIGRVGVP